MTNKQTIKEKVLEKYFFEMLKKPELAHLLVKAEDGLDEIINHYENKIKELEDENKEYKKQINEDIVKIDRLNATVSGLENKIKELQKEIERLNNPLDDEEKESLDLIRKCLNIVFHNKLLSAYELNRIHEIRKRLKYGKKM